MRNPLSFLLCLFILIGAGSASAAPEGRVIVKYRAQSALLKQVQSADRANRMATRLGFVLKAGKRLDSRTEVLHSSAMTSEKLAEVMSAQPDVEYAVPDRLRKIKATTPNDPLFLNQWYLKSVEYAAIRADLAWDLNTGANDTVIAFVDTGVRYDHPDLAAKLLPGYDFIEAAVNAGDADGSDANASDEGDYISIADLGNADLRAICGTLDYSDVTDSSWHGTRVAGILGAETNNATGIAGTHWGAKLLPVRALGKCGGYDSEIIAGMKWAAGIDVPGVPSNPIPNRAKIINLSLGGDGTCSSAYADTINELNNLGVLVVASAGNNSSKVEVPANCSGVLAVAGVRHVGSKVSLSSFGPEVAISAPSGNCVNTVGGCLYSIDTTSNTGSTVPVDGAAGATYTDQTNSSVGTSFSSPMAAAVAALVLGSNPALTPAQLIAQIKRSARPFPPPDPALPDCPENSSSSSNECNCTTGTCGSGLLNAYGALTSLTQPYAVFRVLDSLSVYNPIRLNGAASSAIPGRSIVNWRWQLLSAPAGATLTSFDQSSTELNTTAAGLYVVSLTITDDLGTESTYQASLDVPAAVPPTIQIDPMDSMVTNASVRLDGRNCILSAGRTIVSWHWELRSSPSPNASITDTDQSIATLRTTAPGDYVVALTVIDDLGATATGEETFTVLSPPSSGGGGGGSLDIYLLFGLFGLFALSDRIRKIPG